MKILRRSSVLLIFLIPLTCFLVLDTLDAGERIARGLHGVPRESTPPMARQGLILVNTLVILLSVFPLLLVLVFPRMAPSHAFTLLMGWLFWIAIWDFVNLGFTGSGPRQMVKITLEICLVLAAAWRSRREAACPK